MHILLTEIGLDWTVFLYSLARYIMPFVFLSFLFIIVVLMQLLLLLWDILLSSLSLEFDSCRDGRNGRDVVVRSRRMWLLHFGREQ